MKIQSISILFLLPISVGTLSAATVLVGGSSNNGNFNDNSLSNASGTRSYDNTLFWTKLDSSTFVDATTDVLIGGLADRNLNVRRQSIVSIAAGNTGYLIALGDIFDVSYDWVDGAGWLDGNDEISIRLFTTNDNTITGTVSYIATTNSGVKGVTSAASLQQVDQNGFYTAGSGDVGKNLFVAITSVSSGTSTNAFARVDNFALEVTSVPEPASALFVLGSIFGVALRRRR